MIVNRSRKYELKPNKTQEIALKRTAGCTRYAYNWGLGKAIEIKELEGKFPSFAEVSRMWTQHKKEEGFEWLNEVQAIPTFDAIKNLNDAFKRFYKKQNHFPAFKKKHSKQKFKIARRSSELVPLLIDDRHIRIPIIGTVKTKESMKHIGKPINATINADADRWFVSIAYEVEIPDPVTVDGEPIGIDLGLMSFATFSDGVKINSPNPLKRYLNELAKLQRQYSKKQKGSNNCKKTAQKIAKLHRRIKNIRNDFAHKLSTELVKTKPIIAIESLDVEGMIQDKKRSRSIADAGWSCFITMIQYKAPFYGSRILKVDKFYPSSKTCNNCGYVLDKLPESIRFWTFHIVVHITIGTSMQRLIF
jgi:putative transposase